MDVDLGPKITEFRLEMRAWIESSAPKGLKDLTNWGGQQVAGGRRGAEMLKLREDPLHQEWEARLQDAKLICPQWPVGVGGRGWDGVRVAVWFEELRRSGVPAVRRGMGESLVGPAIIVHGTPQQRTHFLPKIVGGEDVYCQGYSEPDHGSDLGAVETRGVVDGDEIVITGQKVWTSGAQRANMIFVLCRTDPDAPKHRGLSYVLVPFSPENGVRVQPLRQMSGASGFCEDFLEDARAPLFNIIGGLDNGWAPAMTTLGFERGGNATTAHLGFEQEVWDLIDVARKNGKAADPIVRQQLAWSYAKVQVMRFAGLRLLAGLAKGRSPGPRPRSTSCTGANSTRGSARSPSPSPAPAPAPWCAPTDPDTRPTTGRTCSSPAARAPSTRAPARSSATSSENGRSACPRNRAQRESKQAHRK